MITNDNYQEIVITQWYCSYNTVLSFDVWLHCDRNVIKLKQCSTNIGENVVGCL